MIFTVRTLGLSLLFLLAGNLSAQKLEGMASFYGDKFDGRPTSTGETFRKKGYSAASLDLPWGTVVEVTNLSNGKTTQVRVNDCGPHARGRIIDLSRAAAEDLDMIKGGETRVRLRVIQASNSGPTCKRGAWAKALKAKGQKIPPPPPAWDPTKTAAIKPVNPVVAGNQAANPAVPVPAGATRGMASYYADRFNGQPTSTGEIYSPKLLTAASKAFPYGTLLEVTNVATGDKVTVKVNDCGPHTAGRILDLSRAASDRIGLTRAGTGLVDVTVVQLGDQGPTCDRSAWLAQQREGVAKPAPGRLPTTTVDRRAGRVEATPKPAAPQTYRAPAGYRPPAPVSAQPENLVDAFQLQVGAFGKVKNAENLRQELIGLGFEQAYLTGAGKLTKVYAGATADKVIAEELKAELVEKGFANTSVKPGRVAADQLMTTAGTPPEVAPLQPAPASYGSTVVVPATSSAPAAAKSPAPEFDPEDILFGVQVGAFGNEQGAEKVMAELRAAGFERVYSAKVGKVVRVFSGKFYFQSQAEVEKAKVRAAGFKGASVRRVQ